MNLNLAQSLVSDHIKESRQQAAARQGGAARSAVRKASHRASRRVHRLVRGA